MGSMGRSGVYLGIMAMVLLSVCGPARGADSDGNDDCINSIVPCRDSLNTTGRPPNTCCTPLINVYKTDKACLCALLNNTSAIKAFNINITEALQLPGRCGLNANTSACSNLTDSTANAPSGSSPTTSTSKSPLSSPSSFEILSLLALLLLGVAAQVYQ